MRVTFYDTRLTHDKQTILVKEKAVLCDVPSCHSPLYITEMLNKTCSLETLTEESSYLIAMNTKGGIIGVFHLSKGTVNISLVGIREVFVKALLVGAVQITICHNHPSGDCTPSAEDILLAKRLKKAGELLNVKLVDSIIIGMDGGFLSFHEKGLL